MGRLGGRAVVIEMVGVVVGVVIRGGRGVGVGLRWV